MWLQRSNTINIVVFGPGNTGERDVLELATMYSLEGSPIISVLFPNNAVVLGEPDFGEAPI